MASPLNLAVILSLVDRLTGPMRNAEGAIERFDRVGRTAQGLRNIGTQATTAGAVVGASGAGMAAALHQVLEPAIAFESSMADVNKVLNLDPGPLAALSDEIQKMSTRIPMAATGLADIAAAAGQAGIVKDELLRFTEDAAKMGVAFDIGAGQAGAAMSGLRTIFGLTQDGVVTLGDSINHLSNNMDAKAADMLNVANRAGSTAKLFGLSGQQLNALSATMLALKSPPEVAATGINALLLKLATADKQNGKFQEGLAAIGTSAEKMKAAIQKDAQGALVAFLDKVRGSKDVMGTLSDLFGAEYADDMAKLVGSLDTYKNALGLIGDSADYAGSMLAEYETRAKTTANAQELMGNQANVLAVTLGNLVLPAFNDVLRRSQAFLESVTGFAKANAEVFRFGLLLAMAATAAALVIGPALMVFGAIATGAGVALSVLSALLGPIGLVAAAFAAAGVMIWRNWDGLSTLLSGFWNGLRQGFSAFQPALDALNAAIAPVVATVTDLWDRFTGLFAPVAGLAAAADGLGHAWGLALAEMAAAVATPWLTDAAALIVTAWEQVPGVIAWVEGALSTLWATVGQILTGFGTGFAEVFDPGRFTGLVTVIGPLMDAFTRLGAAIGALMPSMDGAGGSALAFGEMLGRVAGGALGTLADVITMVATGITGLVNAMAGLFSGDFTAVADGLTTAFGGVATFFENLSQRLTGMSLVEAGMALLQGLGDGIAQGAELALSAIGNIADGIVQRFKSLLGIASPSTVFAQFGAWIMDGLRAGLMEKVDSVIASVTGVADMVVGEFKGLLGIHSPSRVFAGFGGDIVAGLRVGIAANDDEAVTAAAGFADKVARIATKGAAMAAVAVPLSVTAAAAGPLTGGPLMAGPLMAAPLMENIGALAAAPAPGPELAPLPQPIAGPGTSPGEAHSGTGTGTGAGAPITINLSVTLNGAGDDDVVRRIEDWVRGDGARLIAQAVDRDGERRARTAFSGGTGGASGGGRS